MGFNSVTLGIFAMCGYTAKPMLDLP